MMLADIFLKVLNMSFAGAVAAVIILWVRLLYRMLPKKYLCVLWCVVLIRLLCPFTFPELGIGQSIQEPIPQNIMEVSEPYIASEIEVIDNTVNRVLEQSFTPQAGASVNPIQVVMILASYVWILGGLGMLIFTAWKLRRFYRVVREAVPDKNLDKKIYRCAVTTPVVTGIVKPKIYLPFSLQEPELSHVLTHEEMHIRRKDHLLKLLFYIAVIVHWFNPLVWISYRLLERDMEMACDEAVLEKLGIEEKKKYCESLLNLEDSKNYFVGNPVAFGESDVKVRVKNVLNYKKPRFWITMIAVVLLVFVTLRCLNGPNQGVHNKNEPAAAMTDVIYPLTKEAVEEAFVQVDLPGMVMEEEYNSAIRTSIDIRDKENRLIAGIASNGEGEKRGLFITLVPYLHSGAASIVLPEEKWEDVINFAALLYGFEDKSVVYQDFIENYKEEAIFTEYQHEEEPYYKEQYEWIKSYGNVTCQIEMCVATDGTRDIQGISFFNVPEYSPLNSEMAAKNFLYFLFTSIPGRYENYLESGDNSLYLNQYAARATENCLQNMDSREYYTMVDSCAFKVDTQVRIINAALTESEETKNDKNTYKYLYTATLNCDKDGEIKEFTVQGSIGVANYLNGWKVYDVLLSDKEALKMYITGESENYLGNTLTTEKVQPHSTESHQDVTDEVMLERFQSEYGWTALANQQLFWDEANGRVVVNYYFEALAEEWQINSAREYGLNTFVLKQYLTLSNPQTYQMWSQEKEIKEVIIQVFCNGTMTYQDVYGEIEDRIVHTESHYER